MLFVGADQAASAPPEQSTPAAMAATASAVGAILQGNGPLARQIISGISVTELSAKGVQVRACALSRLDGPVQAVPVVSPTTHQPDAFAAKVLDLYRTYWRESVNDPSRRTAARQKLLVGLSALLEHAHVVNFEDAESLVAARLARAGFHSLGGQTGLLRDLFLWTQQEERMESVSLPEGTTTTKVFYLDGFLSRGWSAYFMCDQGGAGGWAKPEGLYVIVPSYGNLSDENFRVNFLAHESQHYVDYRHFPGLKGWELEYRAKLVELAYANQTSDKVLTYFIGNQGDDPADAHSYADKRVLAAVRGRLGVATDDALKSVPVATLQQAAVEELRADTARREKGSAEQ
jgi:hypothetical protein